MSPSRYIVPAMAFFLAASVTVATAASLETYADGNSGRVYAIRVTPPVLDANAPRAIPTAASLKATADSFIQQNLQLIGIQDPATELLPATPGTDNLGLSRVKYFQRWHGLDVLGGEITVHLNKDGQVYYVKTKLARDLPANTTPSFAEDAAQNAALEFASDHDQERFSLRTLKSRLIILPLGVLKNDSASTSFLAWEIELVDEATGGDQFGNAYYFDAISRDVLFQVPRLWGLNRKIRDCGRIYVPGVCEQDVVDFHKLGTPPAGVFQNLSPL